MVLYQENTGEVSFEVDIEGGTAGFRIWVDWNQDGHFSSDEVVYQSSGYSSSHSGSFTVPEDVDPGQTRMRIVSHWLRILIRENCEPLVKYKWRYQPL